MKANELMIGDWVYSPKLQKVFKVTGIRDSHEEIESSGCHVPMRMLDPIPLTKEILKANGFEFKSDSCMHYNHYIDVYLNKDGDVFMLIGGHQRWIKYIHELQHALRLCGLNELADNFKVE